jgi:hypothetical protein
MTTERDELAVTGFYGHGAITLTAYPSSRRIRVETRADNSVMDWSELFEFVDEIRKPATVTTAEDLDALPHDSAVGCFDSTDGTLLQVYSRNAQGEWMALGSPLGLTSEGMVRGLSDGDFYLTVLHVGGDR